MSFLQRSPVRTIVGRMAAGLALLGIALLLAACGSASSVGTPANAAAPGSSASAAKSGASPSVSASASSSAGVQAATGGEFRSPSGNITCEVSTTKVLCQTGSPARSVTMNASGGYTTCSGDQCLANAGDGTPTLAYGKTTGAGPFVCTSATSGVTCTAHGKGFVISSSGISSASGSSSSSGSSSAAFSRALAAWKAASNANAAMMGTYFQQAASDLKESGNSSYSKYISELEYLISLPNTDVPAPQRAQAHADAEDLDKFFGTPGLNT